MQRQMMLRIGGPVLLIYVIVLGLGGRMLQHVARQRAEESMRRVAASYASTFDDRLREVSRIAETTARFLEAAPDVADEALYGQLSANVNQSPLVYGSCLAFEPGLRRPREELFAPYVCRDGASLRRMNIGRDVYDWYADPAITWYSEPKKLDRSVWSDPYFDEGAGNVLMSTYSAPFRNASGFAGICTVDIDLARLRGTVGMAIDESVEFVVITGDGRFVFHPQANRIMVQTIYDVATEHNRPQLAALAIQMLRGGSGSAIIDGWDSDDEQLVCFERIPSAGWVFVSRIPTSLVLAEVRQWSLWSGAALGATLLLMLTSIMFLSRGITSPMARMRDRVGELGKGNLDVTLDENASTAELRELAGAFNHMTSELKAHVRNLAVEVAARSRIERDLDVAREIQQGLLPTKSPAVAGYDVAGLSKPADKTGGDYFDWLEQPGGRWFFCLADVSGHGVGPALVTAVCRAYVHASLATGHSLSGLFNRLNDLLAADLPEERFVTFVGAELDPRTHVLSMLSAGHGPTFHYVAAEGRLNEFGAHDLPLGVMLGGDYPPPDHIRLAPGDFVVFLTDGVHECPDATGARFGLDRLRAVLREAASLDAQAIIAHVVGRAGAFSFGLEQEDDVTLLVVKRSAQGDGRE